MRKKFLFREHGRVREGSRRGWVSPPPCPLRNLTGEFRNFRESRDFREFRNLYQWSTDSLI